MVGGLPATGIGYRKQKKGLSAHNATQSFCYPPENLPDKVRALADCLHLRESLLFFSQGDGFHEESHVPAECPHRLLSFFILLSLSRGPAVDGVPVLAGYHRHLGNGEKLVEGIEGGRCTAPSAADYAGTDFHALVKGCGVEQPLEQRHERGIGLCVVDRGADKQPVGFFEFRRQFIDDVVKDALSMTLAVAAGDAPADVLVCPHRQETECLRHPLVISGWYHLYRQKSEENDMSFKDSKVVIVGCGNVGSTIAYTILNQGLCEEIVLIDRNEDKAYAEALDMTHAVYFMNRNIVIRSGTYEDCRNADLVVVTASAPMAKDAHDRLEMLAPSMNIMKSITESVMEAGFSGVFLIVSNPVDIMSYYVWKLSGLPRNQVIGSGTTLDSARLCAELSGLYDLDPKSVEAFICGEHGDSEVILWDSATIGGKAVTAVMEDNAERTKEVTKDALHDRVINLGWEVFNRKGNTCYGIAAAACAIIKSVLFNENRIYPVSVLLDGEYGQENVFLSVPVILDKTGAREIVEIDLSDEERRKLEKSGEIMKSFQDELHL